MLSKSTKNQQISIVLCSASTISTEFYYFCAVCQNNHHFFVGFDTILFKLQFHWHGALDTADVAYPNRLLCYVAKYPTFFWIICISIFIDMCPVLNTLGLNLFIHVKQFTTLAFLVTQAVYRVSKKCPTYVKQKI